MNFLRMAAAAAALLASFLPLSAQAFTVIDVAGREVSFDRPVERVVLGQGLMIHAIAPIAKEDPFAKIVAWRNDLWKTDKNSFNAYAQKFPKMRELPFVGNVDNGTLQTETIVKLNPDVVLLPIESKPPAEEAKLEQTLAGVGAKIVYLDFRADMIKNTEPSLKIIGKLYGHEDRAEAVAAYWKQQMARVTDRLKAASPARQNVLVYRIAGLTGCCATFGPHNFGLMVEQAGGHNIGSDFVPGLYGELNPEQVIASNPDIVVVTGTNWSETEGAKGYVNVGPNAAPTLDESRKALNALMTDPAFTGSKAVANGNVHAIWHMFYTSPYQFVAVQQLAKWFHPDLFADLDPDTTFKEFHDKFLPIPYQPGYWVDARAAN
ncbi:iron complex transport system substrate-binding protein [Phyllobacterium sp. YR620]|uniref:ABC transporter substrate-binding protein n=1 Tax=Phyllobacterium sp. YR620 TaxID=1881066 RepID=UPI000891A820|nr:ABC transporter substrate-binding protein [Phyllobacterium sp. YR620]SDO88558.1 iron complex transport system substrate-binding protein [Phyllobacterium sp. YR620]